MCRSKLWLYEQTLRAEQTLRLQVCTLSLVLFMSMSDFKVPHRRAIMLVKLYLQSKFLRERGHVTSIFIFLWNWLDNHVLLDRLQGPYDNGWTFHISSMETKALEAIPERTYRRALKEASRRNILGSLKYST